MSAVISVGARTGYNRTNFGSHMTWYSQMNYWKSAASKALAQQANVKIMRIQDYYPAGFLPITSWANNHGTYTWTNFDSMLAYNKTMNVKTLLSLGFVGSDQLWEQMGSMPTSATGLPLPADYAGYVGDVLNHIISKGFDVPYIELVNEAFFYFDPQHQWNETKALNFVNLYKAGYDAAKIANSAILCGNDASLYNIGSKSMSLSQWWKNNGLILDFLSGHKYDSWGREYPDTSDYPNCQGFCSAEKKYFIYYDANHVTVDQGRAVWQNPNMPALFTESNYGADYGPTDPRYQGVVGQAWCGIVAMNCIRYGIDYFHYFDWASSPDMSYNPPSLGFGLIRLDTSTPYETYNVLRDIFANLSVGDEILETTISGISNVRAQAWRHNGVVYCIVVNLSPSSVSVVFEGQTTNFSTYGTQILQAGTKYMFAHWQDGDTNPTKTVNV